MKFYLAVDSEGRKQLRGTKELILKVNKTFEVIDIPTDKEGLEHLVQDSFDTIFNLEQQIGSSAPAVGSDGSQEQVASGETSRPQAEPSVRPTYMDTFNAAKMAERQTQPKTDEIVDFIFDHASNNQVATIFSAIGTRFSELAKENEKLTAA